MARRPSYVKVPGSDALRTHRRGESAAAVIEKAPPQSTARVTVAGAVGDVVVGHALLQGPQVPLLLDVADRLGPLLTPESFAVYVQLYRLAVHEGKNAARVSLSELSRRTCLRGRRLNKAVADAVSAGVIALVDRTRDGTLYRVLLPDEALAVTPSSPPPSGAPPSGAPPPEPVERRTGIRSVGDVCRWFAERYGESRGRRGADVAEATFALLEEGHTFAVIPSLLERFVKKAPKTVPLRDVARYLS